MAASIARNDVVVLRLCRQEGFVSASDERRMLMDRHADYTIAALDDERFDGILIALVGLLGRQIVPWRALASLVVQLPRL